MLNSEIQTVELAYAGQEVAVRDAVNTAFVNDYQAIEISLEKIMESDELLKSTAMITTRMSASDFLRQKKSQRQTAVQFPKTDIFRKYLFAKI